jgi:MFS family permease
MPFTSSAAPDSPAPAAKPRWRDVYVASLARAASNCGDMLAATALALILQGRGYGGMAVAGLLIAAAVPLTVAGPLTGRLADRVDSYLAIPVAGLLIRTRRGGRLRAGPDARDRAAAYGGGQHVFRLRSDALLWPLLTLVGAVVAAISAVDVVDVFFVRDTLHSSATGYGLIGAVWLAGMVIGALIWSRQRKSEIGTARALLVACAATSAVLAAAGLVPGIGWLGPAWLVGGALNGAENVQLGVMLGSRVRPEVRGQRARGSTASLAARTRSASCSAARCSRSPRRVPSSSPAG